MSDEVKIDYQSRDDFTAERKRTGALRALFGPSKDEIWRQLAERAHAEFVKGGMGPGLEGRRPHRPMDGHA